MFEVLYCKWVTMYASSVRSVSFHVTFDLVGGFPTVVGGVCFSSCYKYLLPKAMKMYFVIETVAVGNLVLY